jgi:hypothetical protein
MIIEFILLLEKKEKNFDTYLFIYARQPSKLKNVHVSMDT